MHRSLLQRLLVLTVTVSVAAIAHTALTAQATITQAQFTLPRGSVFEIIAQESITNPQYSWILTRDGTFVEAKREALFRSRLIEAGTYTLNAEVLNESGTQKHRSEIRIIVRDQSNTQTTEADDTLVITTPALDTRNRIITSTNEMVLYLESANEDIVSFTLDLDGTNDNDAAGTYFASRATPLFVWFTDLQLTPAIDVKATLQDGSTQTQRIRLVDRATAQQEDRKASTMATITAEDLGEGRYHFIPTFENDPTYPALFEWKFGDNTKSLLDAPIHTYARNGSFQVSLVVRNLKTGEASQAVKQTIQVTSVPAPDTPHIEEEPEETSESGSLLGLLLKIALIGGLAVLIGIGVVFMLSKLRKSTSLQEKLEIAEQKLGAMGEDPQEDVPPPMEVLDEDSSDSKEKNESKEAKESKEPITQPEPQPKPEPAPTPVRPAKPEGRSGDPQPPTPAPEPEPAPTSGPTPDWLQPKKKEAKDSKEAKEPSQKQPKYEPEPKPKPKPKPEPKPEPKPAPTPKPQPPTPQSNDENLPPWLQPTPEKVEAPIKDSGDSSSFTKATENKKDSNDSKEPKSQPELKPDDQPIAFLRAESVEEEQKKNDQDQGDNTPQK